MDFVVVCFKREISPLVLQARSLARSNARHFITRYLVLWNEDTPDAELTTLLEASLLAELQPAGIPLVLMSRSAFMPDGLADSVTGSRTQQVLKLAIAPFVQTRRYCVLDSKNHVIRDFERTDFLAPDGRMRSHRQSYGATTIWGGRVAAALNYFDLEDPDGARVGRLPTTTPYILVRDRVCDLLEAVEAREGCDFATAFLTRPLLTDTTEFLLWYAWLLQCDPALPGQLYAMEERIYVSFFNTSPQGEVAIASELARTQASVVKVLSVHRGRYHRLTPAETETFIALWLRAGLFETAEECAAFIEHGTIGNHRKRKLP